MDERSHAARDEPPAGPSRPFLAFLSLTSALCGAIVMVIEVLGSRVLGPFFGVSLFVWTSLITVTLVALAAGYAAGGLLSDRRRGPESLYGIVLLAGVAILLVPRMKPAVLRSSMAFDLRLGSLLAAAVLFGPALFLLGCVSPYVVRLAAREMRAIGRTVGLFGAVSTAGSFADTIATGFWLVAFFRVDRIFVVAGGTLVALAAAYFLLFHGRRGAALLLLLPVLLREPAALREKVQANGTKVTVVHASDGYYGSIRVLDYSHGERRIRELAIDGLIQGGVDTRDGLSVYPYPYVMQLLPYGTRPDGKECLVLGLGAGVVPRWFGERGIRTDVVDIDPRIVAIARDHFGFVASGDVFVADARYHLATSTKRYDYLLVDLANGDFAPAHALSLEAFRLYRDRLTPRGILVINLIGSIESDGIVTASVLATLGQVFGTVRAYLTQDPAGAGVQNLEILAHDIPDARFDPARVAGFPVHPMVEAVVRETLGREVKLPPGVPALVLSDDRSPIEYHDIRVKERIRRGILAYTDWDLLM